MVYTRHKSVKIKEIVAEKKEWVKRYNDYSYDYWKYRWDYLCRRLIQSSDMERQLRHQQRTYPKKEEISLDKG
jgi:hypothetical protein